MKYFPVTVICIALLLSFLQSPNASESKEERIQMHMLRAQEFLKILRMDIAIKEAKSALKLNKNYAPAHHLLANIYLRMGTLKGRSGAESEAEKAIKNDPNNPEYRVTLAKIYEAQGFKENAKKSLEQTVELFPDYQEALYLLAELYDHTFARYQKLVSGDQVGVFNEKIIPFMQEQGYYVDRGIRDHLQSTPVVEFEGFANEALDKAVKIYQKLDELNPEFKDVKRKKMLLAYRTENWEEMICLAKRLVEQDPENSKSYLMLGLGYQRNSEYAEADSAYEGFLSRVHPFDRPHFDFFDEFLSEEEKAALKRMSSNERVEYHRVFWRGRDPLFLSEYNERKLEHYARVAETELLFSIPSDNIPGWKTDRGMVWIRYGPPLKRVRNLNLENAGMSLRDYLSRPQDLKKENLYEFWYYNHFALLFYEFPLWSGRVRFADSPGYSFSNIARAIQRVSQDAYQMKVKGKNIRFPYYAVDFRGKRRKTRVEIFSEFPLNGLVHVEENGEYVGKAKQGTFIFNRYWYEVERDVRELNSKSPVPVDSTSRKTLFARNSYNLSPGRYALSIEIMDANSGNVGAVRNEFDVEKYAFDSLQVSDILLAKNIITETPTDSSLIGELDYTPNVSRYYKKPETVFLYFEIYNLQLTGVPGNSDFQVEYSVRFKKSEEESMWNPLTILSRLFSFSKDTYELATSAEYSGDRPVENLHIEIDPASLPSGVYQLSLRVSDRLAERTVAKQTVFYLEE